MNVVGLNGRDYRIDLKKYEKQRTKCSYYHKIAREILNEKFKGFTVYEEVKLPGTVNPAKKSALYLDFFIPRVMIGVEVHGEQHFKYVPYFHKSKAGFLQAKKRDLDKEEWCRINEIDLVVLRYDSSEDYWRDQIDRIQRPTG